MEKQSITNTSSSPWIRGSCIGRGCFGTVSKAVSKIDGGVFAVKSVDLATCRPSQSESLENEITILRSLKSHPHIVRFLGDDVSKEGTTSFRNLHLEYSPEGDVSNGGIVVDETLLRRYAWCLVSALGHVHSNGIVHCDVKSKNVLVVNGGSSVKLADFGSAMEFKKPTAGIAPRGSPLWMAPEAIRGEYQGPESDVWSLGCTVIEMLTGKPAWEDNGFDSLSRIGYSNELPFIPAGVSELGRDFLDKCLRRDRSQRWSCGQLLEHPFLCQDHHSFVTESSPRCVLDWVNSDFEEDEESDVSRVESTVSAMARMSKLATTGGVKWESNGWIEVRANAFEESGAQGEYLVSTRVESELNTSVRPPGNEESTSAMTCELLLLLVVENIQIYVKFYSIIIRVIYFCYHHEYNNKKKLREKISFILSLNFLFGNACDSDRSIYFLKALLRGVMSVLTLNCCLFLLITLVYTIPSWFGSGRFVTKYYYFYYILKVVRDELRPCK
ncbi:mitogen-activated protein kinase kinase kinase 18 [Brassica rapa]|uniref:mitogen-activated protein kinase kinase kinase 18 n=1 Tax=Brassica campestris TaxID=3711 RepID=UPI00142E2BA7|nr:mitogen-activated protein kinase kinase kinase 18 [Brassica rapa]